MVYITEKNKDILENITKRFRKSQIFFPLFSRRLLFKKKIEFLNVYVNKNA